MKEQTTESYYLCDTKIHYIEVSLSYEEWQEDDSWIARCPELQLADYGDTLKEAINHLYEMIFTDLICSIERGELDAMLKKLGFNQKNMPVPHRKFYVQKIKVSE